MVPPLEWARRWFRRVMLGFAVLAGLGQSIAEEPKPVVVETAVLRERVETLRVTGSVFSRRYSKLSAEVEGLVQQLLVDKGSVVRRGDVLCRIDSTFAQLDVEDAAYRVGRGQAARAEAQRQYDEGTGLAKEKIVAASDLESLRSRLRIAESELKREVLLEKRSRETLQRYDLRAPFDGMVVSKQVEEGEWINRGGTALTIVELDVVFVEFLVPQIYYHRLSQEREVVIQFDALPGREFSGRVTGVIALTSETSRSFPVRIELPNPEHLIAPGMSARGTLPIVSTAQGNVLLIPSDAVLRSPSGRETVWVVEQDGAGSTLKAVEREVEIGRRQGELVEVASGQLVQGERVVVRGNERLNTGDLVDVVVSASSEEGL